MAAAALHDDSRGDDEVYHRDNIFEFFRNHTAAGPSTPLEDPPARDRPAVDARVRCRFPHQKRRSDGMLGWHRPA